MGEPALSASLLRSLSDRVYEKRKNAALDIEAKMRELAEHPRGEAEIERTLELLGKEYAGSSQANFRKGGLIGLAAATLGLNSMAHKWLHMLLPPILQCFPDQDSRVRYYSCEALYNVAKVTRSRLLPHLNEIFQGLCRLCADIDQGVKNGAQLLDRLLKDIVASDPSFEVDSFVPVLRQHLNHTSSHVRHFLIGWVSTLHSMLHVDLHPHLPLLLEGMFAMLNDSSREIRQRADSCLAQLLRTLSASEAIAFDDLTPVLVRCASTAELSRPVGADRGRSTEPGRPVEDAAEGADERIRVALVWLLEFVRQGKQALLPFAGDIAAALLAAGGKGASRELAELCAGIDGVLRDTIAAQSAGGVNVVDNLDHVAVLASVLGSLHSQGTALTRMRALAWLELLVDLKWPEAAGGTAINTTLLAPLVSMLRDRDEQVLRRTLTVMAKVSAKSDAALPLIVRELLALFAEDSMLMQERSGVMLKELCLRIDPEAVYLRLAAELEAREGDEVARCLTEKLTMILLTVPEMASLRDRLRTDSAPAAHAAARTGPAHVGAGPAHVGAGEAAAAARGGGRELFQALDRAWSRHFPAAGLGLCLLAGEYARSCALVERIGQRMRDSSGEETLRVLVQLDKLVQLVESPVLAPLRMQLLRPAEHPHLVRAMYGVLMLLPQSEAFEVLRRRLKAVPTLALLALAPPPQDPSAAGLLSS